ncbi:hypothetical protein BT69DRAFT_266597 [Atractiella rhizophila]|nr:hypothetical protein BT69DRAFT_266597 [Atractiella rhizophila]
MPPTRHSSRQRSSSARANLSTIPLAKALASPFMANGSHFSSQDGASPSSVTLPSPLPSPSPLSFTPVLFPIGERSTQSLGPEGIEFRVEDEMEEDCEFEVVKEKRLAEDGKQYTSFVLKLRERKANCPPPLGLAARRNPTVNVVPVNVPPSPPRDSPLSSPPRTPENSAYWKSPKDNRPYETPPSVPMTPRMRRGLASSYYPQKVSSSTGSKRDSYLALAETYRQRMSREGSEEEGDEAILFSSPQKSPRHGIYVGSYAAGAQDGEEEKSAGEKAIENVLNFQTPESDSVNSVAFGNLVVPDEDKEERAISWDGYTKVLGTSFGIESESETNQGSIAASSSLARDSYRKSSVASSEVTAVNSSNGTEDQRDSPSTTIFARRMGKPNLVLPNLGLNAQQSDVYNLQSHWSETDDGDTEEEEGFSVEEKEQANSGEPIHIISVVS